MDEDYPEQTAYESTVQFGRLAKPNRPTVRQELERRIAEHKQIVKDLEAARDALTPEIETALNALRKVGI